MSGFVVKLQGWPSPCWLASVVGDPGRTCRVSSARVYTTERGARIALGMARRYRPLPRAEVLPAEPMRGPGGLCDCMSPGCECDRVAGEDGVCARCRSEHSPVAEQAERRGA